MTIIRSKVDINIIQVYFELTQYYDNIILN